MVLQDGSPSFVGCPNSPNLFICLLRILTGRKKWRNEDQNDACMKNPVSGQSIHQKTRSYTPYQCFVFFFLANTRFLFFSSRDLLFICVKLQGNNLASFFVIKSLLFLSNTSRRVLGDRIHSAPFGCLW